MKSRFVLPLVAALAFAAPAAIAQPASDVAAHHPAATQQVDQRFQRMTAMMEQAKGAHGAERMKLMQEHMQLMQEQMQSMRGMMGGGMMGAGGMGPKGSAGGAGMMRGPASAGATTDQLNQMQARMDMMQQMMEQMLGQQNMMMQQQKTK